MRKWRKGGLALAATLALSVSLGAGTALAAGTTSVGGDGANWTVPTHAMTNTVWKDANGNLVAEGTAGATQYKVLTTWAEAWSTSGPDYLGVSNSAYFGNGGNGNAKVETYDAAAKTTTVGVWATSANESPNAYNWNMFYNLYADTAEGIAAGAEKSNWTSASTTTNGGADWSTEAGVWTGFKYRPEVVWLNNNLSATQAETYITQIQQGQYSATATAGEERGSAYTPDAAGDGSYDSSYYIEGDENYDPQIIQPNNNSPYSFVASAYELADAAEKVIADTADYAGLSDGQTLDWKTVNLLPRSNRYSETPTECALNVEKLAKGSVYYTLSKIADGTVEKKKVAYVCYPWSYQTSSGGQGGPGGGGQGGGGQGGQGGGQATTTTVTTETQVVVAVYDYTENIGTGPMDGRASWTPLTVDQLSTDSVYTEKTGGGAVNSSDSSTTTYTLYYATADDLADCDVVYCSPSVGKSATELQQWIETNASSDSIAARAADISYLTMWPCITNGSNYTMEKLIYGAYGMDFIYPELFPSMQLSSFWCDEIYHLTDSSLASAMSWIYASASLPEGTTLSNIPAQYSLSTVNAKFDEGLAYYQSHTTSDATISRVLSNTALDGTTSLGGEAYAFNGFAPTEAWTNGATPSVPSFPDVEAGAWYAESVGLVSSLGLMTGYGDTGLFGVGAPLTRAELASILCRYAGGDDAPAANATGMADVEDNAWYSGAANWAVEAGVISGRENADGTRSFDPSAAVTTQEFAAMIKNFADKGAAADVSALGRFTDGDQVEDWARESVAWAADAGLINGFENADGTRSLLPFASIERERAATILANAINAGVM